MPAPVGSSCKPRDVRLDASLSLEDCFEELLHELDEVSEGDVSIRGDAALCATWDRRDLGFNERISSQLILLTVRFARSSFEE